MERPLAVNFGYKHCGLYYKMLKQCKNASEWKLAAAESLNNSGRRSLVDNRRPMPFISVECKTLDWSVGTWRSMIC